MIILLILLLLMQPAVAEPLVGGVDYNEYILDKEDGKEQPHKTITIDWQDWWWRLRKAASMAKIEQHPGADLPVIVSVKYEVTVYSNGDIDVISKNDLNYDDHLPMFLLIKKAYESLAHTEYTKFPEGTKKLFVCSGSPLNYAKPEIVSN